MPSISVSAALIASAAISAGGSYLAGQSQASAANNSTALQGQIYQQNRTDLSPWRVTGQTALSQLAGELGLSVPGYGGATGTGGGLNPTAGFGGVTAGSGGGQTPGVIAAMAGGAHSKSGLDFLSPAGLFRKNASPLQDIAAALNAGQPVSDQSWAMAGFGPGGSDPNAPAQAPGTGTQTPFQSGFRETPGYQFSYNEGMRAVNADRSAAGMAQSGSRLKALQERGTGLADQEYNNYLNRLAALSGVGQTTATTLGQLGQSYATSAGQSMQDAGAARASGYAGVANSFSGGLSDYARLGAQYGWGGSGGGSGWYGGGTSSEGSIPSVYVTPQVPF